MKLFSGSNIVTVPNKAGKWHASLFKREGLFSKTLLNSTLQFNKRGYDTEEQAKQACIVRDRKDHFAQRIEKDLTIALFKNEVSHGTR